MPETELIPEYASHFTPYRKILNRFLKHDLAMFEVPRPGRILDIGCGLGEDLQKLYGLGYTQVQGIDADPQFVERRGKLPIELGTIEKIPFPNEAFDAVLVNNVFHHISDYEVALHEIQRVLRSGGSLCFIEPRNSVYRRGMDLLTFKTPLPRVSPAVRARYDVMLGEIQSGLYPLWLRSHTLFFDLLKRDFAVEWIKPSWFFYFGKVSKKSLRNH